ncbi:MAG: hypothetical protein A3J48_00165 [Candidatus Doudnabacteria bacterium RIFCSPHIGHO2_02_FULL_46_11]|uniref:DoxX subfamily n=1 Tax=Candidatus Doudnabacteria bacterium RIFCSPHIGHO2_02_FULL_46_11 TaxID=1817832 RepID=A0A1F5P992_9BACT|nr:MAG: hypothetical protein A3J48_00165 [Candidatus Doudnabacteria bacterium RIFCSPHIGHO2_02_FULL_46_11]
MNKYQKKLVFALRITIGWLFLYAGITKVLNPDWSAAGYLNNAQSFTGFYQWLASDNMIAITNFANAWGLTIIGFLLLVGLFVRWASIAGAVVMMLYYFPILNFPKVGDHSYIVDEHIIYAVVLLLLGALKAGEYWGSEDWGRKLLKRR